jgi:hypothetical protein
MAWLSFSGSAEVARSDQPHYSKDRRSGEYLLAGMKPPAAPARRLAARKMRFGLPRRYW